jgi:hypothetical protein
MFGVSGSGVSCLWSLYFTQIMKVGVSLAALTILAVLVALFGGSNLTLGRRKLMPNSEQVALNVPTVNSNACSDLSPRQKVFGLLDSLSRKLTRSPLRFHFER